MLGYMWKCFSRHKLINLAFCSDGRITTALAQEEELFSVQTATPQLPTPSEIVALPEVEEAQDAQVQLLELLCQRLVILFLVEGVSVVVIHHILQMLAPIVLTNRSCKLYMHPQLSICSG